jgi:hypothetical protein
LYLLPSLNVKLRPTILKMKPGTRVVSHAFTMDDWQADQTDTVEGRTAYLWIVPAKVEGAWHLGSGELMLKQTFQMVSGMLASGSSTTPITGGRLRGDQISFIAGGAQYTGRVSGPVIQGTVNAGGRTRKWKATRSSK